MGDVNIQVPVAKAFKEEEAPILGAVEVPLEKQPVTIDLSNEPVKISVCSRCGGYPKVVFVEGNNCVKGKCFQKFMNELLSGGDDGTEQLPS